ncbi:hypothetical protein BDN70DRAFT_868041 [Pholiota conissans]|uniref:Cytochrome b561 domain-containing protein n=1 Tax=Pholiota conissans TaxID=109636 RepID=A0A9P5YPM2_9AGAR|nr:hypothetical protein BDN70DRAFT_868041 [Pholiota conissans]
MMGFDDTKVEEGRAGDTLSREVALIAASVLMVITWTMVLVNSPGQIGWFALHPPLQTLAVLSFTFGIITLQPTNQPKSKAAGLIRHEVAIFVIGFPSIIVGTFAVSYNKYLRSADHFTTWHGTIGIICMAWLLFQAGLGAGSVWFGGALFGGGLKAKLLWKYHRLSGYFLFPLLLLSVNLGGAWSNWSAKYSIWIVRFVAFTIAPAAIAGGVYTRVRTFKMRFVK